MTQSVPDIILAGGSGALDPALYPDDSVAGHNRYDDEPEDPQPPGWHSGDAPPWCAIWLGVE